MSDESASTHWRTCSTCKKQILYNQKYWVCNVSTCNRKRTGLVFCSVNCWDAHLPIMNHRQAWSEERHSPSMEQWKKILSEESSDSGGQTASTRRAPANKGSNMDSKSDLEKDILVVVSKLKNYVRAKSGMNTSGDVAEQLSKYLRNQCDDAIIRARQAGRKTIMARDFQ